MDKGTRRMLADIEAEVAYTRRMTGRDRLSPRVMHAMAKVARDKFVPPAMRTAAFDNGPLPIGHGQTISQPYIVALMTDLVEPQPEHVILEVGTGSGYQTAILAELCRKVYSVEVVEALGDAAVARLQDLGYLNVETRIGNGYEGWPEHAPYDGVIVTAAASRIPQPLIDQLKPGGRLVIPVGQPYSYQELMLVSKDNTGQISSRSVLGVAFVPLIEKA